LIAPSGTRAFASIEFSMITRQHVSNSVLDARRLVLISKVDWVSSLHILHIFNPFASTYFDLTIPHETHDDI
jgi:hypothetical protein